MSTPSESASKRITVFEQPFQDTHETDQHQAPIGPPERMPRNRIKKRFSRCGRCAARAERWVARIASIRWPVQSFQSFEMGTARIEGSLLSGRVAWPS